MKRPHTLVVNLNDSRCGACGQSADPSELTHATRLGYQPGAGCGERYVFVTTDYSDTGGLYDRVRAMRPDLTAEFLSTEDPPPSPAEEKVVDLMAALEESVNEAKAERDRHLAARAEDPPGGTQ